MENAIVKANFPNTINQITKIKITKIKININMNNRVKVRFNTKIIVNSKVVHYLTLG